MPAPPTSPHMPSPLFLKRLFYFLRGDISVRSELGSGTTFRVLLPLRQSVA